MQSNIFEMISQPFKFDKDKEIKLFEAFSGVGMQAMALNELDINYKSVGYSEIDKYAIQSYQAIHDNDNNYGDISKIQGCELPEIDIFTYSFPCTDLSKAGQQKGLDDTRSGLVYEVLRILHELKELNRLPKVLLMENVVDLVQVKFIKQFNEIQAELEKLGYSNYAEVLNAKDYGVAQNRERIFMVSILGDYYYEFPKKQKLEKRLKDYLQPIEEIEEKYFLSKKALATFTDMTNRNGYIRGDKFKPYGRDKDYSFAITTREACVATANYVIEPICLNSQVDGKQPSLQDRVYDSDGISTRITTSFHPNVTQEVGGVIIPEATKQGYDIAKDGDSVNLEQPNSKTRRGRVGKQEVNTLTTSCNQGVVVKYPRIIDEKSSNKFKRKPQSETSPTIVCDGRFIVEENNFIIRKLTPLECWRLMGIRDEDFCKAQSVCSNSQLYKQAGNGIVVNVLTEIFRKLF